MLRRALIASLASASLALAAAGAAAYEIKPREPDRAFSGKQRPDIVGLSSAVEGSKAGAIFETYLKDLPGVQPEATRRTFGNTNVSYVAAMTFAAPAAAGRGEESMTALFSSPASANRAYYIARGLGFAASGQTSKAEMIQRVTAKYGEPTAIGDRRLYYFYKGGRIVSVKPRYDAAAAATAIDQPINPKVAVALNDAQGRGSCVAALKRAQASDKTLNGLLSEARTANCDALLGVELSPGVTPDRVGKADFTLIDFKLIVSAAKIDAEAAAAEKNENVNRTPPGAAPKL